MAEKYIAIQNDVITKYGIDICDGTKCKNDWSRTHAHIRERRVCKWRQANSIRSTFTLLHEVGHIENNDSHILGHAMRRSEAEYYATKWALDRCKEYGITVPHDIIEKYVAYVLMEIDRGERRGLDNHRCDIEHIRRAVKEW